MKTDTKRCRAQSATEYLLLLGAVAVIALVGFNKYFPRIQYESDYYFNQTIGDLMGPPPNDLISPDIYP